MLLDFYFDYSSPFAYLASTQVEDLAGRTGATLRYQPFLLGALFKAIGAPNVPMAELNPAKLQVQRKDTARWFEYREVPFRFPSRFPMNTVKALRMTLQMDAPVSFIHAVYRAYWTEDRDINDDAVLVELADGVGAPGEKLLEGTQDPAIKQQLKDVTSRAVDLGLCGAPSFIVKRDEADDGMLFWGQDRLEFVEKALGGWRPKSG